MKGSLIPRAEQMVSNMSCICFAFNSWAALCKLGVYYQGSNFVCRGGYVCTSYYFLFP